MNRNLVIARISMKIIYFCCFLCQTLYGQSIEIVDPRTGGSKNNPGIKVRITEKGLRYANEQAGNSLNDKIQHGRIPDLSESFSNGWVKVSNIQITNFGAPNYNYNLRSPDHVSWSLNRASISVKGEWRGKYKKWFIKIGGSGIVTASAQNVAISVSAKLRKTTNGKLRFEAVGCSSSIRSLNLNIKGGIIGWLVNIFRDLIAKKLKPVMEDSLCKLAKKFVSGDANRKLNILPSDFQLKEIFKVDYRLIGNPTVASNYLETSHKGEITHISSTSTPFYPHRLSTGNSTSKMLYLWTSDYVLNSLLHHAHQNDVSKYIITETSSSKYGKHLRLSCSHSELCLGTVFPEILTIFPEAKAEISVKTTNDPIIQFMDGKANIRGTGDLKVYIIDKDARILLLKVGLSGIADLQVKISDASSNRLKIYGEMAIESMLVTSVDGEYSYLIGDENMQMFIDYSMPYVQEQANKFLSKGLPVLVTQEVHVRNLELKFLPRTLELGLDIIITDKEDKVNND